MLYSFSEKERDTIIAALIDYIDREKADCDLHDIPYEHIDDLMDAMSLCDKLQDIKGME